MFARITVQSGIAAGTSHLIEDRVARVGSDPDSEICLPTASIPGHALTLEFREDSCRVYNRCRDNVYIGVHAVEPDQVVEWPETDILQLGHETELLLDFDYEAIAHVADEELETDQDDQPIAQGDSESTLPEDRKQKGSTATLMMQLTVIVICLVGCVLLLVRDQDRKAASDSGPDFPQVISMASELSPELTRRIQYAEAQRIRGREEAAREKYQAIRDDLLSQLSQTNQSSETPNALVLKFVQTRLSTD